MNSTHHVTLAIDRNDDEVPPGGLGQMGKSEN